MKYVVKNCKALISNGICELYSQKGIHLISYCYCKDKNCLIKQVIEMCLDYPKQCEIEGNCIDDRCCASCFLGGGCELAQDILQLFGIKECEE